MFVFLSCLQKNDSYVRYIVSTSYEVCHDFYIGAKDAKEAAKLAGMVLMHFGYLKSYTKDKYQCSKVFTLYMCFGGFIKFLNLFIAIVIINVHK